MDLQLQFSKINPKNSVAVSGSKSETNRLLLLQALYPELQLENASDSDDSAVMRKALSSDEKVVDIHHAGTAMRFLTAFFAIQEGREVILTGSPRMQERPIKILVDALRDLGAEIRYEKNEGFPPLRICGKRLVKNKIVLPANVSSQYISALLLIAPKLENGLELELTGTITSIPYINMTLGLLRELGMTAAFIGNTIKVNAHSEIASNTIAVESDWSSASYFYAITALSEIGTQLTLSTYKPNSLQGDSALWEIYKDFGVETFFEGNQMILTKVSNELWSITLDLNNTPDLAQTIAVSAFALGLDCHLTGLHTLKIKETDRLVALQTELTKLGASIAVTDDSLTIEPCSKINPNISIATYHDHRMAMAFAPLALRVPITIEDAGVVSKSFPAFWDNLKSLGFSFSEMG